MQSVRIRSVRSVSQDATRPPRRMLPTLLAMGLLTALAAGPSLGMAAGAAGTAGGGDPSLQSVTLPDPSFGGMPATVVTFPAGWRVEGQMGTNHCIGSMSIANWSAKSPDGEEYLDVLPLFRWRSGAGAQNAQGCDPRSDAPPAADFLQSFAALLPGHVQILGPMPVAAAFRSREEGYTQRVRSDLSPDNQVAGDVAALHVIDGKGYEMRLRAWLQCERNAQGSDCFALVDIVRAPRGKLDALVALVDGHDLLQDRPTPQWMAAYNARQNHGGSP